MLLATDAMTQAPTERPERRWRRSSLGCAPAATRPWNAPTACPGWAAKDVVVHLLDNHGLAYERYAPQLKPAAPGL